MRWRQVIVLYLVLGALGAEYWLVERRRAPASTETPRQRFLPIAADAVREVRLARGGRHVLSRRDGAGWTVVEPPQAPIPSDLLSAFTNALAGAEEIARVGGPEAKLEEFGLDERAARVEVLAEGREPLLVTIGDTNPSGTGVYARRGDAPEVVLIGRQVRYYEQLIFEAASAGRVPAAPEGAPIGG